jgi:hypothetical protein
MFIVSDLWAITGEEKLQITKFMTLLLAKPSSILSTTVMYLWEIAWSF